MTGEPGDVLYSRKTFAEKTCGLPIKNVGWALLREKFAEKLSLKAAIPRKLVKVFTCEGFWFYSIVSLLS